jgi:hypothetical protein
VYFDLILDDSEDKVFVQCAWEIHTESKDSFGYIRYYTHPHFIEEFKIKDDSDVPEAFKSAETIKAEKAKEYEAKMKEEAKLNSGFIKSSINGHEITYKGKDKKQGKYTNLYYTDDVKKINDTDIVEQKKEWKDERLKGFFTIHAVMKVNRIDEVAKKFFYNIVGFLGSSKTETDIFIPYEDKKEREARTTVKNGVLKLPIENLPTSYEIPAFEVKKAEVVKPAEDAGDGKHHFEVNGFKATSKDDKKASLKKAVYDDIVCFEFSKYQFENPDNRYVTITGYSKEDHNILAYCLAWQRLLIAAWSRTK